MPTPGPEWRRTTRLYWWWRPATEGDIYAAYFVNGAWRYYRVQRYGLLDQEMIRVENVFLGNANSIPVGWVALGQRSPVCQPPPTAREFTPAILIDDPTEVFDMPRRPATPAPERRPPFNVPAPDVLRILPRTIVGHDTLPLPPPDFVESVRDFGVCTPIIVQAQPHGDTYTLVAGRRRLAAHIVANGLDEPISAVTYPHGTEARTLYAISVTENNHRSPNVVLDHDMLGRLGELTGEDLAAALHLPDGLVEQRARLASLLPALRPHVESGRVAPQIALRIAAMVTARQAALLATLESRIALERTSPNTAERGVLTSRDLGPSSADLALTDIADQIERLPRSAYPSVDQVERIARLIGFAVVPNQVEVDRMTRARYQQATQRIAILEASVRALEAQLIEARSAQPAQPAPTSVREALRPLAPGERPSRSLRNDTTESDDPEERGEPLVIVDARPDVNVEDGNESWEAVVSHMRAAQRVLPPVPDTTHDNTYRMVSAAVAEVERVIAAATAPAAATASTNRAPRRRPTPTIAIPTPEQMAEASRGIRQFGERLRQAGVSLPGQQASGNVPVTERNAAHVRTGAARAPREANREGGGIAGLSEAERLLADMAAQINSNDRR